MSNQNIFTRSHVSARIRSFSTARLYLMSAFEIDTQAAHLFKHPHLGIDDIDDVWASDPLFYPAKPPAHWLMCAEAGGRVLVVPLGSRAQR